MIEQIDHIGIAVKDLEASMKVYTDILGLEPAMTEELEEQGIVVAKFPVGEVTIELVQAIRPDGPIGKFIEKRGEGMHHMAFRVPDIDAALEEMKAKGVELIDKESRGGSGGTRIAFLHPKGTSGVLMELVEQPK